MLGSIDEENTDSGLLVEFLKLPCKSLAQILLNTLFIYSDTEGNRALRKPCRAGKHH